MHERERCIEYTVNLTIYLVVVYGGRQPFSIESEIWSTRDPDNVEMGVAICSSHTYLTALLATLHERLYTGRIRG
jgi:hypothetical protein